MDLLLHELMHLLIGLIIGFLVWKKYKHAPTAFIFALVGGFLIDADHLFDYFLAYGFNFNLATFFNNEQFGVNNKVYVPLHGWEYVAILTIFYYYFQQKIADKKIKYAKIFLSFLLALTLGIYSHLIIDTLTNNVVPLGYSLIYRISVNFNSKDVTNGKLPHN